MSWKDIIRIIEDPETPFYITEEEKQSGVILSQGRVRFCVDKNTIPPGFAKHFFSPGSNIFPQLDFDYIFVEEKTADGKDIKVWYIRKATPGNMISFLSLSSKYNVYPLPYISTVQSWLKKTYGVRIIVVTEEQLGPSLKYKSIVKGLNLQGKEIINMSSSYWGSVSQAIHDILEELSNGLTKEI